MPMSAAHDVLEHGHVVEQLQVLERAADAEHRDVACGSSAPIVASAETDGAVVERLIAADEVEQRRLAGAVGADQCGDRARRHREADLVDGAQTAEGARGVRDLEQRRCLIVGGGIDAAAPRRLAVIDTAVAPCAHEPVVESPMKPAKPRGNAISMTT